MAFTNLDYTALFITLWKISKNARRDAGIYASQLLFNPKKHYFLLDVFCQDWKSLCENTLIRTILAPQLLDTL